MTNNQTAKFTGFSIGFLTLAVVFYSHVDRSIMAQNRLRANELEDFKQWAEEICDHGYSTAEFLSTGEYKAVCR